MSDFPTSRREFIKTAGAGALALPLLGRSEETEKDDRPNVILIYVDDASFYHFGCYGGPVATPNIDSLARNGIKFTRFYVSSAVCTPSRYGVVTGRFASRSRALLDDFPQGKPVSLSWNTFVSRAEETLAGVLKKNGYATGMVGKWHLSPMDPGINQDRESIDPETPGDVARLESRYHRDCSIIREVGGFDYADAVYFTNINALPIPRRLRYHNVEWQVRKAMDFVEQNKDRPFFLYWATPIIHSPNPMLSLESDPTITPKGYLKEAPNVQPPRKDLFDRLYTYGVIDPREDGKGYWETLYGAAGMAWLDEGIGALLKYLDRLGLAENTMIIVASDNGYQRGKNTCYEAGANVPCVVHRPEKVPAGVECGQLVSNVDIAPTVLAACGIAPPAEVQMDGVDFRPLFEEPDKPVRNSVYCEIGYTRAVVTKEWKYLAVRYPDEVNRQISAANRQEFSHDGTRDVDHRFGAHIYYPGYFDYDQLYCLKDDPDEQINLAGNPRHASRLDELKGEMEKYCKGLPHSFGEFKKNF